MVATRWKIGFLMFLGILINYLDRVNISHAILLISKDINMSSSEQGVILSAFSWGYVFFMLPGGWLVDRYGPRTINSLSCIIWSFFTALTALAGGVWTLILSRFFLGVAEAPIFPGNAKVVRTIFPLNERGRATALFDIGSYTGILIAGPFIIFIMLWKGWQLAFLICAGLGFLWGVIWFVFYKHPNKTIDNPDLTEISSEQTTHLFTRKILFNLLTDKKILGISFGFFCYNYLKSFFLTWFPSYLVEERGFTILKVGFVSIAPPLCAILAEIFTGFVTDSLIKKGVSTTLARKVPLCIGLLLSSIIIITAFVDNEVMIVVLLTLSYASLISASASIWAIPGDISPDENMVGTIGSIQNTFSNIAGIIAPIVTGFIYELTGSFLLPITISGLLCILGSASYWFVVGDLSKIELEKQLSL